MTLSSFGTLYLLTIIVHQRTLWYGNAKVDRQSRERTIWYWLLRTFMSGISIHYMWIWSCVELNITHVNFIFAFSTRRDEQKHNQNQFDYSNLQQGEKFLDRLNSNSSFVAMNTQVYTDVYMLCTCMSFSKALCVIVCSFLIILYVNIIYSTKTIIYFFQ